MNKHLKKEQCNKWVIAILFLLMVFGLLYFLGSLNISQYDYERLVLYSILTIFGISMSAETCLYKRLREEEKNLKNDLEKLKKEVRQMKK